MAPLSTTRMRWAALAVCSRWAMRIVVRAARHQAHGALDACFCGQVEVGGGLIKEQDRRVDQERPGEAEQLAFPG